METVFIQSKDVMNNELEAIQKVLKEKFGDIVPKKIFFTRPDGYDCRALVYIDDINDYDPYSGKLKCAIVIDDISVKDFSNNVCGVPEDNDNAFIKYQIFVLYMNFGVHVDVISKILNRSKKYINDILASMKLDNYYND